MRRRATTAEWLRWAVVALLIACNFAQLEVNRLTADRLEVAERRIDQLVEVAEALTVALEGLTRPDECGP